MLHELLQDVEGHRGDVGAGLGGVDDVQRVADGRGEHLCLEALHAIDLADVAHEVHADRADVVETPEKRADVERTRLRRQQCLCGREAERLVHPAPFAGHALHGFQAVVGERALDDHVRGDLRQLFAFLDHAFEVGRDDLEADVAGDDPADLLDERPEWLLLLGGQRRVRRDPVHDPERDAFLDLVHVRRVEKDLHVAPLSSVTRVPARTFLNMVASPLTRPTTLTGLAGRISLPRLAGVGPKKMQNAWPGGQNARSPMVTTSFAPSASARTGMPKWISSPHVSALASIGSASQMAVAVLESFSSATALTCPAVIRIARAIEPEPRLRLGVKSRRDDRTRGVDRVAARKR